MMSVPGLDPLTGALALPLWAAGALSALILVLAAIAFGRIRRDGLGTGAGVVAVLLIAVILAWFFVDGTARQDFAAERRALEARAGALATRATMPGSALACLDALAGETVESSCERRLFATPEAMAAAVSYVAAQWSLFADASTYLRRSKDRGIEPLMSGLRRPLESDRYGLVAHVLATSDACTDERCAPLALLREPQRVKTNLTQHTYEFYVARHSGEWPAPASGPVAARPAAPPAVAGAVSQGHPAASALPPGAAAFVAPRVPGPDVFFPSSDSIPPVNIMTAEPPPSREPESTAGTPQSNAPSRRPAPKQAAPKQSAPKQAAPAPMDLNGARGAPTAQ